MQARAHKLHHHLPPVGQFKRTRIPPKPIFIDAASIYVFISFIFSLGWVDEMMAGNENQKRFKAEKMRQLKAEEVSPSIVHQRVPSLFITHINSPSKG